ncbi:hypothetical protein D9M71_701990 [compost metagenome]
MKIANGAISRPSRQDWFLPKKRVMMLTMISGMRMPHRAWMIATREKIRWKNTSQLLPTAASWVPMPVWSRPPATPTTMGAPTAPNETGVDCTSMPSTTAAMAGKPRATINGATTAAGVPKPDAPSMKQPNSQATISA